MSTTIFITTPRFCECTDQDAPRVQILFGGLHGIKAFRFVCHTCESFVDVEYEKLSWDYEYEKAERPPEPAKVVEGAKPVEHSREFTAFDRSVCRKLGVKWEEENQ